MNNENIISQIFGNSTSLPSRLVVENLVSSGICACPEFAEPVIDSWIEKGFMVFEDKKLTLLPNPREVKENWFKLRQLEKSGVEPVIMKIQAEAFERWCGWAYFILDNDLRRSCEAIGYVAKPEQRREFQKFLQK